MQSHQVLKSVSQSTEKVSVVQLVESSVKTAVCSLFVLLLNGLSSNSVHVHDSLLGECLSHSDGLSFGRVESSGSNKTCFFKLHEAETDVLTSTSAFVLALSSISGSGAVVLTETVDTDLLTHVELVSN